MALVVVLSMCWDSCCCNYCGHNQKEALSTHTYRTPGKCRHRRAGSQNCQNEQEQRQRV
jgi:hypothetical protein